MIVDGKKLAERAFEELGVAVRALPRAPRLRVIVVGENLVTKSYVRIKEKKAAKVGIVYTVESLPKDVSPEVLKSAINSSDADAVVLQMPLPVHIDTDSILKHIPENKDADVMSPVAMEHFAAGDSTALMPPVVFAVAQSLADFNVNIQNMRALVVGNGRLVGQPVVAWLRLQGIRTQVVTRSCGDMSRELAQSDLVISGAGVPNLIKVDDIREGAVLIDAGTSESGGIIVGDIDPRCKEKASVFTPVPGGIGPLTIAGLLKNVAELAKRRLLS